MVNWRNFEGWQGEGFGLEVRKTGEVFCCFLKNSFLGKRKLLMVSELRDEKSRKILRKLLDFAAAVGSVSSMSTADLSPDLSSPGYAHGLPLCDRLRYASMSDAALAREFLDLTKGTFDRVFGGNAKRARNFVAVVLISRGHTEINNPFGNIKIEIVQS